MKRRVSTMPAMPNGRLIRKMLRQPKAPTRTPPTVGPSAKDADTIADQSPSTRVRPRGSGNSLRSSARELGMNSAAPTPWTSLAAMSTSIAGASAAASDAAKNTAMPHR
ncbi:hypothetical protein LUX39_15040 [Actinomadura madurae]|nr:hypothetical protein [Actinomadura madurae]MCQ0014902.1 hypothetical protein [Actinomadura madurae]